MEVSKLNSPKRSFPLEFTRNIGIAAHIDAGKTTTSERILFYTGVTHKVGEVHDGESVTDWMEQEKERGITIVSAAISCSWETKEGPYANIRQRINIIDTPGHVDFTAEVERSLRVLDGAIAVFCGVAGVQPQSETVWRQMNKYNVPRIAFINKMDRTGANFMNAINDIRKKLGGNAHPLFIPIGEGEDFRGLVSLLKSEAYIYAEGDTLSTNYQKVEVPQEFLEARKQARQELIEALADVDEVIAERFLEEKEPTIEEMQAAIRRTTIAQTFIGVVPGSAFKNKGIQLLLDAVIDYLPSPLDLPPVAAHGEDDSSLEVETNDGGKVVGLVFKLATDPYIGKLVFFRVYRGSLQKGSILYNPRTRKTERISRLVIIKANSREDIDTVYSGDICGIVGAKDVVTGDTLCDKDLDIRLEPPTFPDPVISMSIEPKTKSDQEKLSLGLQRLAEEDPTFRITSNVETGQTLISGMGELHLEIIRDRLFREFKVEADAGKPQIAYRETITKAAEGEGKFVRQSGGRGQYGHVVLKIEPAEKGKGITILNEIVGGAIPKEYIKPTEEGIREGALNGTVAGYPVTDFVVHIVDGTFHEVDSSELAFKMAGIFAFKEVMKKAGPILLEPIMSVEVSTPDEYQGDILGDINRRRGQIHGMETKGAFSNVMAFVPLETMFGYATDIRSLTKGRASYSMQPSHFEQVPSSLLQNIVDTVSRAPARS